MARRAVKEKQTGQKPGGRVPKAPMPDPQAKDQVNFTDEESRIMPVSGGGFEQAYNGQLGVDGDSRLLVCQHVSQQPNDKQALVPALDRLAQLPEELGKVETASADTGYSSEDTVSACEKAGVVPLIGFRHFGLRDLKAVQGEWTLVCIAFNLKRLPHPKRSEKGC